MPNTKNGAYEPTRMCVLCRKKTQKKELLRYVFIKQNNTQNEVSAQNITLDKDKICEGRGYYLCKECNNEGKLSKIRLKKPKTKKV